MTKQKSKKKKKGPGGRKKKSAEDKSRGEQLAKLIKASRNKIKLKQAELAAKASVGLDTLRSIECARVHSPNAFIIADLAKALGEDLNKWLK